MSFTCTLLVHYYGVNVMNVTAYLPGTYLPGTYQTREILIQICYPLPNGGFDSFELPVLPVCVTEVTPSLMVVLSFLFTTEGIGAKKQTYYGGNVSRRPDSVH